MVFWIIRCQISLIYNLNGHRSVDKETDCKVINVSSNQTVIIFEYANKCEFRRNWTETHTEISRKVIV